jgi:AmmeMemoRadiSam system protein B
MLIDRLEITPEVTFIPEGLLPIVGRFDGMHTVAEIREEVEQATGQELPDGFIEGLVQQLDERLLLNSPRFSQALGQAADEFLAHQARPARHAGSPGYPATAGRLKEALTSMVGQPRPPQRPTPRGLIAPHIDLARGREGYAQAYGYLAESEPADLYVVFGTGHQGPSAPLTGLPMDWATPIRTLPTDREFVAAVHRKLGGPAAEDQLLHRDEHSLEFPMVFLAHLFEGHPVQVAGFLTGSLPTQDGDPTGESYIQQIFAAFRELEEVGNRRICYVASADLAHLGPFFGDPDPVDTARLRRLEEDERGRLAHLQGNRPGQFHREVMAAGNPDRVCGLTPIFLAASLAEVPGELLHYGQAAAPDGSQVVSFCSVGFA